MKRHPNGRTGDTEDAMPVSRHSRRRNIGTAARPGRAAVLHQAAWALDWALLGSGALFLWRLSSLAHGGIQ